MCSLIHFHNLILLLLLLLLLLLFLLLLLLLFILKRYSPFWTMVSNTIVLPSRRPVAIACLFVYSHYS
jgi:hypothetical protein